MKKTIYYAVVVLCLALSNYSCSSDDSANDLKPDFVFESANIICPIASNYQISWEANVINKGNEQGSITVQAWLSTDKALGNDAPAGGLVFGEANPEESLFRSFGATVANVADYKYLLLQIDHNEQEDELDETNNLIAIEIPTGYPYATCKPENFDDIANGDISFNENNLSDSSIEASNSNGNIFKLADVLIYKTNKGRFGKLRVISIDDANNKKLTIKAVTYNSDGSIYNNTDFLEIRGTWTCDLDDMVESSNSEEEDFWWQRINSTNTEFTPKNAAKFYKYSF